MGRLSIIAMLAIALVPAAAGRAAARPPYQPFPAGYGYMEPAELDKLARAVAAGDRATVRDHAWKLWAGIMQPSADPAWPVWHTWPDTEDAFAPAGTASATLALNAKAGWSLIERDRLLLAGRATDGAIPVNVKVAPRYPVPKPVRDTYPLATSQCATRDNPNNICDGAHFLFNGDIMIPSESLSQEGLDWIRDRRAPLYEKATLDKLHGAGVHELAAPQRYIVTKHMFWPVKAGRLGVVPVWHDYRGPQYPDYAGYETWTDLVAVDPSGKSVGQTAKVSYLYGVYRYYGHIPWPTVTASAKVHGLDEFYVHQVTQADWDSFDEADKAILDASSYWAYNQPFGPGDFLVTVAMHINTRELPGWALQSVWWSDAPGQGPYAADRPTLTQAKGPWQHYLLADAYGIPDKPGGNQPVAMNPYIELVIHPVGTNCNNCHRRAGWPMQDPGKPAVPGMASYQNPDCPDALATLSSRSACLAPLTLSDFQWIIPDRAIGPASQ